MLLVKLVLPQQQDLQMDFQLTASASICDERSTSFHRIFNYAPITFFHFRGPEGKTKYSLVQRVTIESRLIQQQLEQYSDIDLILRYQGRRLLDPQKKYALFAYRTKVYAFSGKDRWNRAFSSLKR